MKLLIHVVRRGNAVVTQVEIEEHGVVIARPVMVEEGQRLEISDPNDKRIDLIEVKNDAQHRARGKVITGETVIPPGTHRVLIGQPQPFPPPEHSAGSVPNCFACRLTPAMLMQLGHETYVRMLRDAADALAPPPPRGDDASDIGQQS